ncbi:MULTISPECIES: serine/threonine-protein kinase [unclassified Streptomyces]|uniref:serine/threonine-protein kinase n=1 Tax=unclassified Streptomyces TaxID=2593676 RepID=UPI00365D4C40
MEQLHPVDPHHIGPYRLLCRLGAGGMGQVYLARSDRGRTVAVKLVHPALALREEFRSRFRHEVAAARRVGGDWTAPVLDADTEADVPWFATGYIAGPSLRQAVSHDFGPLPVRTVRILASGLARALQDIHRAGLIHRDLKPSNVLLTVDGPRIIDFGIARPPQRPPGDPDAGLTRTGELIGSPGFTAPEQVLGGPVTPACDVFCLGAVLAYAATDRLPFGDARQPGGGAGPSRPHVASTVFLLVVAVVVAMAAGGSVYAVMSAEPERPSPTPAPTASVGGPVPKSAPPAGSRGADPSGTPVAAPGTLPAAYTGTWRATHGSSTWHLTLVPGAVGEPVMALRVENPGYVCSWRAPLRKGPDPVELDASTVDPGSPPTCTSGSRSRLRLLPDGTLRRELEEASIPPLTYHRE